MIVHILGVDAANDRFNNVVESCGRIAAIRVNVTDNWQEAKAGQKVQLTLYAPDNKPPPYTTDEGTSRDGDGAVVYLFELQEGEAEPKVEKVIASFEHGCCDAQLRWGEITTCHLDVRFHNQVEFILDGVDFFGKLRTKLLEVRNAPPDPKRTYVRLATWALDPEMLLAPDALKDPCPGNLERANARYEAARKRYREIFAGGGEAAQERRRVKGLFDDTKQEYEKAKAEYENLKDRYDSLYEDADDKEALYLRQLMGSRDRSKAKTDTLENALNEEKLKLEALEPGWYEVQVELDDAKAKREEAERDLRRFHSHWQLFGCLRRVARRHPVDLIVWEPTIQSGPVPDFVTTNVGYLNKLKELLKTKGCKKINLLTHNHGKRHPTLAMHQKMVIFAVDGQLSALVGGFNCEQNYLDSPAHDRSIKASNGKHWVHHDTAVWVKGPAVADVEEEFLKWWHEALGGYSYFTRSSTASAREAVRLLKPTQYQNDQPGCGAPLAVKPLVTNSKTGNRREIQTKILELIGGAEEYLYIEGYQFHYDGFVTAVGNAIKKEHSPKFCVVLPGVRSAGNGPDSFMSRISYARLLFDDPDTTAFSYWANDALERVPKEGWSLQMVYEYFLGDSCLTKEPEEEEEEARKEVLLCNIQQFERTSEDPVPRVVFYHPKKGGDHIYIHSKLLLCDDKHLVIGSANFGSRSQLYDSELNLHIEVLEPSRGFIYGVKGNLFGHYGVGGNSQAPKALWDHSLGPDMLLSDDPNELRLVRVEPWNMVGQLSFDPKSWGKLAWTSGTYEDY